MSLDLSPFVKALASLERALERACAVPEDAELRDACIQRFEYTYELAWKMLKRQIEAEVANPSEVDGFSFRQLFRVAGERGLVDDVEAWFDYREQRNLTTHTYHEETARRVFSVLPAFARDAGSLLSRLGGRDAG